MIRSLALIASLVCAGPSLGHAQADKALMAKAAELAQICADTMPNSRAAKDALKAAGLNYRGSDGRYHVFTPNGFRVVAGITVTHVAEQSCLVSVSKMTPAEANGLIQPWVKLAKAKPAKPPSTGLSGFWVGRFKNGPIRLGVIDQVDFGVMSGAAIAALAK